MKTLVKRYTPAGMWRTLRRGKHGALRLMRRFSEGGGLTVTRTRDYYSPLPSEFELARSRSRWDRPSSLAGVTYDLPAMRARLSALVARHHAGFAALPPYATLIQAGYGPGYPQVDAFTLYAMIRELQPARYFEIGSGLSTYYCELARQHNCQAGGRNTAITCVEPYPFANLRTLEGIHLIAKPVQEVPPEFFGALQAGDVLFIDSSHVLRMDGDVAHIFLEILPVLAPGVQVHIHDIPFPYNIPYPAGYWTLLQDQGSPHWPMYWNEAMLLQAFLAFNSAFEITLSCPLLRHFDEPFCRQALPMYQSVAEVPNTFSSIWLQRTR